MTEEIDHHTFAYDAGTYRLSIEEIRRCALELKSPRLFISGKDRQTAIDMIANHIQTLFELNSGLYASLRSLEIGDTQTLHDLLAISHRVSISSLGAHNSVCNPPVTIKDLSAARRCGPEGDLETDRDHLEKLAEDFRTRATEA